MERINRKHLRKNFTRGKVADKPAEGAGAEFTAHTTADLRGYALRIAVFIAHKNALYYVAVGKPEQILFRSVG